MVAQHGRGIGRNKNLFDHILVRYGEINTKGQNRSQLERLLLRNVQDAIMSWPAVKVKRISNRILVTLHGTKAAPVVQRLQSVFGISSLSLVMVAPLDVEGIVQAAKQLLSQSSPQASFKVNVRRGNKRFVMNSPELARHVGGALLEQFPERTVDVHQPDVVIHIDVRDEGVYLFADKVEAANGLPVGMSGRVLGLLSGGIDSPVAVWQAMKRGLSVDLVHFHSFPFTSERAQRKVEELASRLAEWSREMKLQLISLTEVQSAIQKACPECLRTVVLRRMMFRITSELAHQYGHLALVTGDSLGQVASQTLDALFVVDSATDLTILRPLVTEDKLDIIRQAQKIGTYETSIQPYDDCCSLFAPKHPKTHPTLADIASAEAKLDVKKLVQDALATLEVKRIGGLAQETGMSMAIR